jgi:hypothetical protein
MYIHLVIEDLCALYLLGCSLVNYPISRLVLRLRLIFSWSGVVRTGIDLLGGIFPFATGFAGSGSKSFIEAWEFM